MLKNAAKKSKGGNSRVGQLKSDLGKKIKSKIAQEVVDQEAMLKHISNGTGFPFKDVLYGHQHDVIYFQDGMYITSSFQERSKNLTS